MLAHICPKTQVRAAQPICSQIRVHDMTHLKMYIKKLLFQIKNLMWNMTDSSCSVKE